MWILRRAASEKLRGRPCQEQTHVLAEQFSSMEHDDRPSTAQPRKAPAARRADERPPGGPPGRQRTLAARSVAGSDPRRPRRPRQGRRRLRGAQGEHDRLCRTRPRGSGPSAVRHRASPAGRLAAILQFQEHVAAPPWTYGSPPDEDDVMFLEVALQTAARTLVTGNVRHFPPRCRGSVTVWSPRAAQRAPHFTGVPETR